MCWQNVPVCLSLFSPAPVRNPQAIVVVSIMAWEAKSQAYAVLGVAGVSLLLQVQFSPYEIGKGSTGQCSFSLHLVELLSKRLVSCVWTGFLSPNRLETLSLSAICLTFYFALFLFEAEADSPELVGRVTQHCRTCRSSRRNATPFPLQCSAWSWC